MDRGPGDGGPGDRAPGDRAPGDRDAHACDPVQHGMPTRDPVQWIPGSGSLEGGCNVCLWLEGGVVTTPPRVVTTILVVTTPVRTGCKL